MVSMFASLFLDDGVDAATGDLIMFESDLSPRRQQVKGLGRDTENGANGTAGSKVEFEGIMVSSKSPSLPTLRRWCLLSGIFTVLAAAKGYKQCPQ
jgi:hypothetical protein